MPRKKNENGLSTIRIQAVLNRKHFREIDAVKVAETLIAENPQKWTHRYLITESLIALGEKLDSGYHPQHVPSTLTLGADVAKMLQDIQGVVSMLANMDLDALRGVRGFDEQAYNIATTGASKLISGDVQFDNGEDW